MPDVQRVLRGDPSERRATMQNDQKSMISNMRKQGHSYKEIADQLSLSVNTIKSYCRRNNPENTVVCKQCGLPITIHKKSRPRQFCSDKCRMAWWRSHHGSQIKTEYRMTCANCGQLFVSIGNKSRKYCSRQCYIAARFGGKRDGNE